MAKNEKLKDPPKKPKDDPEMIKRVQLLKDLELYQMIRELKMLKPAKEEKNAEK